MIGLGAGTLAPGAKGDCFASTTSTRRGPYRAARPPFLEDSDATEIVLGDARLSLEREPAKIRRARDRRVLEQPFQCTDPSQALGIYRRHELGAVIAFRLNRF